MSKVAKKNYVIEGKDLDAVISILTKRFNLPVVSSSLGIYSMSKGRMLEVMFQNSSCHVMSSSKNSTLDKAYIDIFSTTPPIQIENTNIKYFLKILNELGYSKAHITDEVTRLRYKSKDGLVVYTLNIGTPLGHLLVISCKSDKAQNLDLASYLKTEITSQAIDEEFSKISKERVFNGNGVLHNKIVNYGNKYGIDIASHGTASIKSLLDSKSNNYSTFENIYRQVTGIDLNKSGKRLSKNFFKPVSIVIPAHNPDESLVKCLLAIQSQNLSASQKKMVEVIVVDDGSATSVAQLLRPYLHQFTFDLKVIRLESCSGISSARNLGAERASHEHLLFIDADILISSEYILKHSVANQLIPNGVFVSMKKNVERNTEVCDDENILRGILTPRQFDDKRMTRVFEKGQGWVNVVDLDGVLETVSESDYFKNFGHGRCINGYDLPSMCVGHNMSFNKRILKAVGGFSNQFKGWGLEDAYFGAGAISKGCFLVPLTTVGVYHINHPPRSGSEENKAREYKVNLKIYNQLLNQELHG